MAFSKYQPQMTIRDSSDLDFLLIGKTGYGKSATGNSILQRKVFRSEASMSSVTTSIAYEVSDFQGTIIKVVDCPGVAETRLKDNEQAVNSLMSCVKYAIEINPRGYHAFLLVLKYGCRFTAEDQDAVNFLRETFGQDFVKRHGIIIMTHGDNFEKDHLENKKSFERWCEEQRGNFKSVLEECQNRIILFDNVTKNEDRKVNQVLALLNLVQNMCFKFYRYTNVDFSLAQAAREKLEVEAKKPAINEGTMNMISLMTQKVLRLVSEENTECKDNDLNSLKRQIDELYETISSKDRGTGVLKDLLDHTKFLQIFVKEQIEFSSRMKEYVQKNKQLERESFEKKIELEKKKHQKEKLEIHRHYQEIKEKQSSICTIL